VLNLEEEAAGERTKILERLDELANKRIETGLRP